MALSVKSHSGEISVSTTDHFSSSAFHPVTLAIDADRCIGCGACVSVCPKETLTIENDHVKIQGNESLSCDHCAAACPAEAIRVMAVDASGFAFDSFKSDDKWLGPGKLDTGKLANFMGSRRSCRNYTSAPVPMEMLTDLIKIGMTAPSGSNCQPWAFTILPDRAAVDRLARKIGEFFKRTNQMAENPWFRKGLRMLGKPELGLYYERHYTTVKRGLDAYAEGRKDLLFHGAVAAIAVAAQKDASTPVEDALLATQNILLGAHAMGLGTCLIGFAIEAMRRDRSILRMLKIPESEIPCAMIAIGWPTETYQRVAWRKPAAIRFIDVPSV